MKVTVENIAGLTHKLQQIRKPEPAKVSLIVGYTTKYGIYVHEMTPASPHWGRKRAALHKGNYWDPPGRGQPKFLERPARELHNDGTLARVIVKAVKGGETLEDGLIKAGIVIMGESQRLVPVDTGTLKASATIMTESDNVEHWTK